MIKAIARTSALVLTLALFSVPGTQANAQSVVTGGDPQPTGEAVLRVIFLLPSLTVL